MGLGGKRVTVIMLKSIVAGAVVVDKAIEAKLRDPSNLRGMHCSIIAEHKHLLVEPYATSIC